MQHLQLVGIIPGHANEIMLNILLVAMMREDPVILEGNLIILVEDPTLLGECSVFLLEAETKTKEF
jgi:hypothetical protein